MMRRGGVALAVGLCLGVGSPARAGEGGAIEGPAAPPTAGGAVEAGGAEEAEEEAPRSPHRWMRPTGVAGVAGGLSIFALSYGILAIAGMVAHDLGIRRIEDPSRGPRGEELVKIGRRYVIPVAGPWLALRYVPDEDDRILVGLDGAFQLAGLAMAIGGVSLLVVHKGLQAGEGRQAGRPRRWAVAPWRAGAALTLRF